MELHDLTGALILLGYYLFVCVVIPAPIKYWTPVPREVVRKIQHVGYSMSVFLLLHLFSTWYAAVAVCIAVGLIGYPVLYFIEKKKWYGRAFADRAKRGGEFRSSLITMQLTIVLLITVFWGAFGNRWAPVIGVAVTGWGFGDAAAALVGKAWGKRRVLLRWVDQAKTFEGTAAMIGVGGLAFFLALLFYAGLPWHQSLVITFVVAPVAGVVELMSRRGTDTITVPIAAAFTIIPLMRLFAVIGW